MFSYLLKAVSIAAITTLSFSGSADAGENEYSVTFSTGGALRYPNSVQEKDEGNLFSSGWIKGEVVLAKNEKREFGLLAIGSAALDSEGFAWNNNTRLGFGIFYKTRPAKGLSVTYNLRQEFYQEINSNKQESGRYASINYYYFKSFDPKSDNYVFGLANKGAELKSYGGIKYPGSLKKNDNNLTFNAGIEYALKLELPETKITIMPYISLNLAADLEGKNYNNKIRPAVGFRVKYKLEKGSIYAGLNAEADHRPVDHTTNSDLQLTAGWYKKF